jgi:hypothetical protein
MLDNLDLAKYPVEGKWNVDFVPHNVVLENEPSPSLFGLLYLSLPLNPSSVVPPHCC